MPACSYSASVFWPRASLLKKLTGTFAQAAQGEADGFAEAGAIAGDDRDVVVERLHTEPLLMGSWN